MVLYATIARKGQGPLPFACLESGRVERGEGRKKRGLKGRNLSLKPMQKLRVGLAHTHPHTQI